MADVRINFDRAAARADVDWNKVRATTEADVQRHMAEDGEEPDGEPPVTPAALRARAGLTQAEIARRLRIPLRTWQNWEQGRTAIEPATRTLIELVAADPERAFKTLGTAP